MTYDFIIVGAGIVGLATAERLMAGHRGCSALILEKEAAVAWHQTGHNSGVIHSGVYYTPGTRKAELCLQGARMMSEFCAEHGIAVARIGKLIVATDERESAQLERLVATGLANGLTGVSRVTGTEVAELEPGISAAAGLLIPQSAIVDYVEVARALEGDLRRLGAEFRFGSAVSHIVERSGAVRVELVGGESFSARRVVVCAGLQADRLVRCSGLEPDFRIVPFRGVYFELVAGRHPGTRRLIYPVPDPALPFLGIHVTPKLDGSCVVGPNAVLALGREEYTTWGVCWRDAVSAVSFPGTWALGRRFTRVSLQELRNTVSRRAYLGLCRKYYPGLDEGALGRRFSGVRAQALTRGGSLIDDFHFIVTARTLHVCNAPSPAATAAFALGRHIAQAVSELDQ